MPSPVSWCWTLFTAATEVDTQETNENANEQLIVQSPDLSWLDTPLSEASESQNI